MKKLLFLVSISIFAVMNFPALGAGPAGLPFGGPIAIKWTVGEQAKSGQPVHTNMIHTAKSTNTITRYVSTYNTYSFNTVSLLKLLTNSFSTNLPPGARLVSDGLGLFVTDKTGTNIILDVSAVLGLNYGNTLLATVETVSNTRKPTNNITMDVESGLGISYITIKYDDSGLATTRDGTHTTFNFSGVVTSRFLENFSARGKTAEHFMIKGAGQGTIHGVPALLEGTVVGSLAGFED